MRISYNWLQRYVQFRISPEVLAEKLALIGLEVEGIEHLGKQFDGFVVGEVLQVNKHPNADRLSVSTVDVEGKKVGGKSSSTLQIVCGAPNVKAGQKVAVGLVGAVVPKNQHDPDGKPFILVKVKVRGEESEGMICSAYELGIGTDSSGILVLDGAAKVGMPLAKYFGLDDVVFDISVTPNRPDCLSHIGIAREVAAIVKKKLTIPKIKILEEKKNDIKKSLTIEIKNKKECPRYTARLVRGVTVQTSPQWLQSFLKSVGVRPINNVVDVTNFVMYECGQPLHAFDYEKISGKRIVVKNSSEGEKFMTLDQKEHALLSSTLMICDGERPVAIAGIMGGLNSEISDSTVDIVIESAKFEHTGVRKTAKRLGISTDASYRFERGTDIDGTVFAANRAASLIAEIAGGRIEKGLIDIHSGPTKDSRINLRISHTNKILGTDLSVGAVTKYLSSIGIIVRKATVDSLTCTAPSFRPDLEQEIDLMEEVARLHGYANIEDKMVTAIDFSHRVEAGDDFDDLRRALEGMGFNETVSNSLMDEATAKMFSDNVVTIKNPISRDLSAMRPSLVGSMLQNVYHNNNLGMSDIKLFEVGRTYEKETNGRGKAIVPGFIEKKTLSVCLSGRKERLSWESSDVKIDIYDLKGVVESLLSKILLDKFHFIYYDSHSALTEQTIAVEKDGTYVGFIGKVKSELLKKFSVENDVYVAELNLENIAEASKRYLSYVPSSKFPIVSRDLAFIVKKNIHAEEVESQIKKSGGALLTELVLFDVFEGKPLHESKKSFAFSLRLNSNEKTLTEVEAEQVIKKIVLDVCSKFDAELRTA